MIWDVKNIQFSTNKGFTMKKITIVFLLLLGILHAQSNICQTKWIVADGKKYQPPESVKELKITFINNLDAINLETKNHTTRYDYRAFLDIKGQLGISYKASNGDLVDMFKNGTLIVWRNRTPMLKAHCPTMKLDISKQ